MYFIACTSSLLYNITPIIGSILFDINFMIITTLIFITYQCLLTAVGLTLLVRLYFTFKGSTFAISKCQKLFFIISSLLIESIVIMLMVEYIMDINIYLRVSAQIVFTIMYFSSSIYGMVLFTSKMCQLTKMMRCSIDTESKVNEKQQQLLYATTKYVTLLSIAMISSWIAMLGGTILGHYGDLYIQYCLFDVDVMINIICLYLQFPFNKHYYDKYCDWMCNFILNLIMTKSVNEVLANQSKQDLGDNQCIKDNETKQLPQSEDKCVPDIVIENIRQEPMEEQKCVDQMVDTANHSSDEISSNKEDVHNLPSEPLYIQTSNSTASNNESLLNKTMKEVLMIPSVHEMIDINVEEDEQ